MKAITLHGMKVETIDCASLNAGSQYLCKFPDGHTEWFDSWELEFVSDAPENTMAEILSTLNA